MEIVTDKISEIVYNSEDNFGVTMFQTICLDDILVVSLVSLNLVLSFIIVIWDLYYYFKISEPERWTKLLYALVGFFWIIRYTLFFLDKEPFNLLSINRPVLVLTTFTLLSLAVASIIRVGRDFDTKNVIKSFIIDVSRRISSWILPKN